MKPKGRVFVSGAYSGTPEEIALNIAMASRVCEEVLNIGWVPICPNVYWNQFEGFQDYDFWLEAAIGLIETCRILVLVPGWGNSSGVAKEVLRAKELGIPILTILELATYNP